MSLEPVITYTLFKPGATIAEVDGLSIQAFDKKVMSVCVPPLFVKRVKEHLKDTSVKTTAVVGFPFGYSIIEAKVAETVMAIVDGADVIEITANLNALKNADWQYLAKEINTILPIIRSKGRIAGVVLESSILDDKELVACCDMYGAAGVDYIKTASGMLEKEDSVETIRLVRNCLANQVKIKTGGPVHDIKHANELLTAGADYISLDNGILRDSGKLS